MEDGKRKVPPLIHLRTATNVLSCGASSASTRPCRSLVRVRAPCSSSRFIAVWLFCRTATCSGVRPSASRGGARDSRGRRMKHAALGSNGARTAPLVPALVSRRTPGSRVQSFSSAGQSDFSTAVQAVRPRSMRVPPIRRQLRRLCIAGLGAGSGAPSKMATAPGTMPPPDGGRVPRGVTGGGTAAGLAMLTRSVGLPAGPGRSRDSLCLSSRGRQRQHPTHW